MPHEMLPGTENCEEAQAPSSGEAPVAQFGVTRRALFR
jgi:hypothetical protein